LTDISETSFSDILGILGIISGVNSFIGSTNDDERSLKMMETEGNKTDFNLKM